MVPFRTISLGQQRLRATITRTPESTARFGYGVLLHVRKERTRITLGLITLAGESLPLTPRLLASITDVTLLLAGQTRVTLGLLDPGQLAEPDRGIDTLLMQVIPEAIESSSTDGNSESGEVLAGVEALVCAQTLLQPIVLLLPSRPRGWPL